jgi:RNA 2',3'-cyclic 3'-phosphodiesterase
LTGTAREPAQRLFFALWPDAEARSALAHASAKAVRHCGGRPVPAANLHATLAFLGSVPQGRIPDLERTASELAAGFAPAEPLALTFDRLVHWPRPQILCALAGAGTPAVLALATALRQALLAAGFSPDLKPFEGHVTVARKVARAPTAPLARPVAWLFDSFALVGSRTESAGPIYSVVESYPLVKAEKAGN